MQEPTDHSLLDVVPEVAAAIATKPGVVALESTIISHGMPYPKNVETALAVEQAVRDAGAVPATIAVINGRLKVGLTEREIRYVGESGTDIVKCSRRDLPVLVARGGDGATTVAGTMIVAAMAGIAVIATGGIGGVHRDIEQTLDVSADLEELGRSDVAVVCSGIKSILDIPRTLEYLETRGVPVIGYGCDTLPAFYTRDSGCAVDYRIDNATEIAGIIRARAGLGLSGGMVVAVPVPEAHAMQNSEIDAVIDAALVAMQAEGISGKATTPYLLARIAEQTAGRSLETNIQLVLNNARVAGAIAAAL